MESYVRFFGCGCIALAVLACGAKGSDGEGDDGDAGAGGTSGTGASGGTSGTTSGGGTAGTAGTAGTGGPLPVMTTYDFTDPTQVCADPFDMNATGCWRWVHSGSGTPTGGPGAGVMSDPVPQADIEVQHTTEDGDPDSGAFEATIPYTMAAQYVSFGINITGTDFTNRVINARVKIASGLGEAAALMMAPGGTKVYAKSGEGYCYANGAYFNQGDSSHPVGQWNTIQFNLLRRPDFEATDCTAPFDVTDIREIGVQFDTSGVAESAETAVVRLDTVEY